MVEQVCSPSYSRQHVPDKPPQHSETLLRERDRDREEEWERGREGGWKKVKLTLYLSTWGLWKSSNTLCTYFSFFNFSSVSLRSPGWSQLPQCWGFVCGPPTPAVNKILGRGEEYWDLNSGLAWAIPPHPPPLFWDKVSLCSPVWSGIPDPPASASLVLGLQARATTPG
jgi:hypothetical protein